MRGRSRASCSSWPSSTCSSTSPSTSRTGLSTLESVSASRVGRRSARAALWRRLRRNTLSLAALGMLIVLTAVALCAPWLTPYDPDAPDAEHTLRAPGLRHWLGTDIYGRDQLTRILHASRIDLLVALGATLMALSTGAVLGALARYRARRAHPPRAAANRPRPALPP